MKLKVSKNLFISDKAKPIIIAEVSANHCGKKNIFLKHIVEAKKAGADMVKIQTYEADDLTLRSNRKEFRIKSGIWKNRNLWDLYKKAQTPYDWHYDAFKIAKKIKIPIFSTPFSIKALKFLDKFKPTIYKVASFEITDLNLIREIAKKRKPVILSTGMAKISEISNAVKEIEKIHKKIIILHCVSGYPTPESEANINKINLLKVKFPNKILGISDHTDDINSSLAAVAMGAKVIEKHFKISNKIKSPDSKFSINPVQLKELKIRSESIFVSIGKQTTKIKDSEKHSYIFRRSIFARKNLKQNIKITNLDIITKRPLIGISADQYYKILGKKTKIDINKDAPIFKKYIKF
jgi:pseudaminic acid synthase